MIIYFPRTFGSSYNMINVVKQYFKQKNIETTIVVSHPDSNSLTLHAADIKLIEPTYNAEENASFYENVVIEFKVNLIIPGESSLVFFKENENKFISLWGKIDDKWRCRIIKYLTIKNIDVSILSRKKY